MFCAVRLIEAIEHGEIDVVIIRDVTAPLRSARAIPDELTDATTIRAVEYARLTHGD